MTKYFEWIITVIRKRSQTNNLSKHQTVTMLNNDLDDRVSLGGCPLLNSRCLLSAAAAALSAASERFCCTFWLSSLSKSMVRLSPSLLTVLFVVDVKPFVKLLLESNSGSKTPSFSVVKVSRILFPRFSWDPLCVSIDWESSRTTLSASTTAVSYTHLTLPTKRIV